MALDPHDTYPFRSHRTMAQVMADEALTAAIVDFAAFKSIGVIRPPSPPREAQGKYPVGTYVLVHLRALGTWEPGHILEWRLVGNLGEAGPRALVQLQGRCVVAFDDDLRIAGSAKGNG